MKNNSTVKFNRNHILILIYAVFALSEILLYWIFHGKENEVVEIYNYVILYLVLPLGSLFISYMLTIEEAPKGSKMLLPLAFGGAIALTEYVSFTIGNLGNGGLPIPSIVLLLYGIFASLFGFSFAKKDRAENEKIERAKRKYQQERGLVQDGSEAEEPKQRITHEDDYNPSKEFIPDEDDTWADEVIAREGFGELKVEYAEHDADFSIDSPDGGAAESTPEAVLEEVADQDMDEDVSYESDEAVNEEVEEAPETEEISDTDDDAEPSEAEEPEQQAEEVEGDSTDDEAKENADAEDGSSEEYESESDETPSEDDESVVEEENVENEQ